MADDNTSVGKISLVIDLTQDLEKEIGKAAKMVADGLQSQLNKTKLKVNIDNSEVKKSIEDIPSSMNSAMNSTKSIVQSATQVMKNSIENNINRTIQNSVAQFSKFSLLGIKSLPGNGGASEILTTNKPEVYTPKVNTDNIIDVDFTELSDKAGETLRQIQGATQETANKTSDSFSRATDSIKGNVDETVADAESKSNGFISGLIAKLRNVKMPNFDFSKFKIPKFDFEKFRTPEPILGTETQRMQMDLLIRQMDAFSAKADMARAHIKELELQIAELSKPTGSPIQDKVNSYAIDKLKQELKATEEEEQKFGMKSDSISIKIAKLEDKMKSAANATNNNTKAVNSKGNALDSTGKKGSLFGSIFSRLTGTMKTAGESSQRSSSLFDKLGLSFGQVGRMMDRMLIRMVLFNTVITWLGNFSSFVGSALMANSQFNASLMQVRSNLYAAFMPIYNAILPALNSLMSALATASSYIASFISQLFGTTYKASFAGASALQSHIGSMDIAEKQAKKTANSLGTIGSSAKKAADGIKEAANASKKGLAGFDQLNKLGSTDPKTPSAGTPAGGGVVSPITPTANMGPIESATQGWINKIKGLFSVISKTKAVQDLKKSFDNLISSIKNAISSLHEFWDLVKPLVIPVIKLGIQLAFETLARTVKSIIDAISGDLKFLSGVLDIITGVATGNTDKIKKGFKKVVDGILDVIGWVKKIQNPILFIGDAFASVFGNKLVKVLNDFKIWVANTFKSIVSSIKNAFNGIGSWFSNIFTGAWNGIKKAFSSVGNFFKGVGSAIKNGFNSAISFIKSLPSNMLAWGKDMVQGLINGIKSKIGGIVDAVKGIGDKIRSFLHFSVPDEGPLTDYEKWMPDFMGGLANGINNSKSLVANAIKGLSGDMTVGVKAGIEQPQIAFAPSGDIQTNVQSTNANSSQRNEGNLSQALYEALEKFYRAHKDNNSGGDTGDVFINVDGDSFAKIAIEQINKRQRMAGKTLLKV